ncbi:hypothetical protein ACGFYE_08855 [Streptomyces zaomyceticus]|uniref:hypothetical protein n=1 Tax=Streptomyces zaomyceticus TaxID=68286 RepID=UPI003720F7A5
MDASSDGVPAEAPSEDGGQVVKAEPDWVHRIKEYRQGDVVRVVSVPLKVQPGVVDWVATPYGAALITQTCDVVLPDRATAHLVPVLQLPAAEAKANRNGRRPHLVHLPELGDCYFADLTYVATVSKSVIAAAERTPGVESIDAVRKFGQRVGRRFSRFAFPDEVVPWIRPLQSLVESKVSKEASPIGWALSKVASLRLECADEWEVAPYLLTLCVVLEPGVLPPFPPDEIPTCSGKVNTWLYGPTGSALVRMHSEIAKYLHDGERTSLDAADRYWLWSALADSWAAMCVPAGNPTADILEAVEGGAVSSEILSTEDFSFERYRHSEEIDLDHLSSPLPM